MLKSRMPLSQVALDCGMCDQPHLSRAFRRIVGTTPAAWRRQFTLRPTSGEGASEAGGGATNRLTVKRTHRHQFRRCSLAGRTRRRAYMSHLQVAHALGHEAFKIRIDGAVLG
jgi:hypothetical protein